MSSTQAEQAESRRQALESHEFPTPGKIAVTATVPPVSERDLALACSSGVAAARERIAADPANAYRPASRGNLVAVAGHGTAALGPGDIGPLASNPVVQGQGVLCKQSAGIDVFDLEVAEGDRARARAAHDLDGRRSDDG